MRYIEERKWKEKREAESVVFTQKLDSLRAEFARNLETLHGAEAELLQRKKELHEGVKGQLVYYYKILQEGVDLRCGGLAWVVEVVMYIEKNAPLYVKFPKYMQDSVKEALNNVNLL